VSTVIDFQVSLSFLSAARAQSGLLPTLELLTSGSRQGLLVITVCGEVDMFTAPLLQARLHEQIRRSGPDLIVDLTAVGFLAAAGLTVLATAHNAAIAAGVAFRVVASTRPVLRPLQVTELAGVLACYPDLDRALAASLAPPLPEPRRSVDKGPAGR
jgi:anti-sigma B factor antagonist